MSSQGKSDGFWGDIILDKYDASMLLYKTQEVAMSNIVVTATVVGKFVGVVGVFSSIDEVTKGIRSYEKVHPHGVETDQSWSEMHPFISQFGDRGEMYYIESELCTYILTMDVPIDRAVGLPSPNPNAPGYTMKE